MRDIDRAGRGPYHLAKVPTSQGKYAKRCLALCEKIDRGNLVADHAKPPSMWVRRSAIRPVPSYARIPTHALDALRAQLSESDDAATRQQLDEAFGRYEQRQPALAAHLAATLARPLDETALGLGYFLAIAVWLGFEQVHGNHVTEVGEQELTATRELLELDEQLRRSDPSDVLETDDVVAMEQPELLEFVHDHVDITLENHAEDIDVDDVHEVYRAVLTEILALSYAVERPAGFPVARSELLA